MTTSAAPLISSDCTRLSSSAIIFGSARRIAARLEPPKVASCKGLEPVARTSVPASRFELALGAQRPMSSCACEATVLLLASPGTPLQLATTGPTARTSILVAASVAGVPQRGEATGQVRAQSVGTLLVRVFLCTYIPVQRTTNTIRDLHAVKVVCVLVDFVMRMRRDQCKSMDLPLTTRPLLAKAARPARTPRAGGAAWLG